jgi:hypothetical protein
MQIRADYHQYYLADWLAHPDWSIHDRMNDGVLSPVPGGITVSTGIQWGPVDVDVTYEEPAAESADAPIAVAAEADLKLASGVVLLMNYEGRIEDRHDFGTPCRVRVRVEVANRDEASRDRQVVERHRIWVWRTQRAKSRWRSTLIDQTGRALQQVTSHVGTQREP